MPTEVRGSTRFGKACSAPSRRRPARLIDLARSEVAPARVRARVERQGTRDADRLSGLRFGEWLVSATLRRSDMPATPGVLSSSLLEEGSLVLFDGVANLFSRHPVNAPEGITDSNIGYSVLEKRTRANRKDEGYLLSDVQSCW